MDKELEIEVADALCVLRRIRNPKDSMDGYIAPSYINIAELLVKLAARIQQLENERANITLPHNQ